MRAGDANPAQLKYWTDAWLDRIGIFTARMTSSWLPGRRKRSPLRGRAAAAARLEKAHASWDDAITVIDEARKKQIAAPGLREPAKKALATLDREWDGLAAHREYPMVSLDNYPDGVVMPMSAVRGGSAAGQGGALAA